MESDFSLLLVEPEETQQKLIEDVLRTEFEIVNVTISNSADDAINRLNTQNGIQCIIANAKLDDNGAFSLIKEIRDIKKYAKTPILAISDIQERHHLLEAAASGASDFIAKPFNPRSITLKLKKLLADKQFRKSTRISTLGAFDVSVCFTDASYNCKLIDISTGGCSIKSLPFQNGGAIFDRATINIDNNGAPIIITSEFARAERDPESTDLEEKSQIASFEFINLDEEIANQISQFIDNLGS